MTSNASSDTRGTVRTIIITWVLTMFSTLATTYCAQDWQNKNMRESTLRERRLQAFAEAMGVRITLAQLAVSFQHSRINRRFHEARFALAHDKLDIEESRRYLQRNEMLITELTKERKRLYELVASIVILFPDIPLDVYLNLRGMGVLNPPPSPKGITKVSELTNWQTEQLALTETQIDDQFGKPIAQLIDHIARSMGLSMQVPIRVPAAQ